MEFKMNTLKLNSTWDDIPGNYTGIVVFPLGNKWWFLNGKLHRIDGPAIEYKNGDKLWYLNGVPYPQEEWFNLLTDEDKLNAVWNLR